jgi:hypothetical protein
MEHAAFITEQNAKLGPANAGGVLQHGLKHARQLAGRARNDAEHFRRCRLLLKRLDQVLARLGKLACARIEFVFKHASMSLEFLYQCGLGFMR